MGGGKGGKGHHLPGRALTHHPLVEIVRQCAIGRVGLHIDALHTTAIDEVVDIGAAPGGAEHIVDIGLGQAQRRQALVQPRAPQAGAGYS